jgi:hypothetical protein
LVDAEGLMFGSVVCLVGVAARFCCLKRGCKTAEKRREKKETGSLTTNNTPWTCNRTEAADECLLGRVEQGGGSITLALYMQAACRRQPLKRDLCCSTCTIFHLDSVIDHVLLFFTCSYLSSRHSASRVREVERSVFYSPPSLSYARCLQPPQSVHTLKCWCASASWSKHYMYFTHPDNNTLKCGHRRNASTGILASTYLARIEPSYDGKRHKVYQPGSSGAGVGEGLRPVRLLNCSCRINELPHSSSSSNPSN